jgi:hypothetical protein
MIVNCRRFFQRFARLKALVRTEASGDSGAAGEKGQATL